MKHLILLSLWLFSSALHAQTTFEFTKLENRKKHDQRLVNEVILRSLAKPLSKNNEAAWQGAFWAMELILYKTAFTKSKVAAAWKNAATTSESFQKALLEVSYTLCPDDFAQDVKRLMNQTTSNTVFARCGEYLLRSKNSSLQKDYLLPLTKQKIEGNNDKILSPFFNRLNQTKKEQLPPINELFSKNFLPGHTVIYSLQRMNRDYPGLVIIRKVDGSFIREKNR